MLLIALASCALVTVDAVHFVWYQNMASPITVSDTSKPLTSIPSENVVSEVKRAWDESGTETWYWYLNCTFDDCSTPPDDSYYLPFVAQTFTVSSSEYSMNDLWFRGDVPMPMCERQCQSKFMRRDLYLSCIAGCACDYNAAEYSTNWTSDTANNGTCVDHCEMEQRYVETDRFVNFFTQPTDTDSDGDGGTTTFTWTVAQYIAGLMTMFNLPIGGDSAWNGFLFNSPFSTQGLLSAYSNPVGRFWRTDDGARQIPLMPSSYWINSVFLSYVGPGAVAGTYQTESGSSNAPSSWTAYHASNVLIPTDTTYGFRFSQRACEEGCQLRNICPATSHDLMYSSYEAYYDFFGIATEYSYWYDYFSASKTVDYWYDYFSISEFDASATLVCNTFLVAFLAW